MNDPERRVVRAWSNVKLAHALEHLNDRDAFIAPMKKAILAEAAQRLRESNTTTRGWSD
jgi:hypothetical protein